MAAGVGSLHRRRDAAAGVHTRCLQTAIGLLVASSFKVGADGGIPNFVAFVREMVAAGLGVTILADIVHRPWSLEGNRIEVRDVIEPVPSLDVDIAWKRKRGLVACGRGIPQVSGVGEQRV